MPLDQLVICGYARTPIGGMLGAFANITAPQLGATAVQEAVQRSGTPADTIDRIYMGCVLAAGLGQAPARQAALGAGLPTSIEATTVNKMCGSGMQAVMMGCDALLADSADIIVAGGMESMTNAPYLLSKHRQGARLGHDTLKDSMFLDGLEDAYETGTPMGVFADRSAQDFQLTRIAQDDYALASLQKALTAIQTGAFKNEIVKVKTKTKSGSADIVEDEQPGSAKPDRIPTLKPVFVPNGTVTAANSSSISDGAAAMVITRRSVAEKHGMPILAYIAARAGHAHAPSLFTTAPVPAIRKVLDKAGWELNEVGLFEINEAFAVVPMIAMRELGIPADILNVNGGATALGHPIGASGARIMVTLLSAMQARNEKKGVASLCIGGGEATAIALELA